MRLIDENEENQGVVETKEAQEIAKKKGLDLVEVQPNAQPPVVRLMDYSKYKYQQQKAAKKGKSKETKVKGVRFSLRTSGHDLETKAKQADRFLKQGHKVRVQLFLRGREKGKKEYAQEKLEQFIDMLEETAEYEQPPKKHPMGMVAMLHKKS